MIPAASTVMTPDAARSLLADMPTVDLTALAGHLRDSPAGLSIVPDEMADAAHAAIKLAKRDDASPASVVAAMLLLRRLRPPKASATPTKSEGVLPAMTVEEARKALPFTDPQVAELVAWLHGAEDGPETCQILVEKLRQVPKAKPSDVIAWGQALFVLARA
jgi:hypothetical protein